MPRLIPAHAGKTLEAVIPRSCQGAHPRSRGENYYSSVHAFVDEGSSPLTRGKPIRKRPTHRCRRLIPAHAGKTRGRRCTTRGAPAHPRSRGENVVAASSWGGRQGSSPLTRGKQHFANAVDVERRLIPAHAGKTSALFCAWATLGAHPRSRGENPVEHFTAVCRVGSSPLTRGKPGGRQTAAIRAGLIPAHAGKTGAQVSRRGA